MVRKEILALVGSPHKKGNSDIMANALIEGARMSGHSVTKIYMSDYKVGGCWAVTNAGPMVLIVFRRMRCCRNMKIGSAV